MILLAMLLTSIVWFAVLVLVLKGRLIGTLIVVQPKDDDEYLFFESNKDLRNVSRMKWVIMRVSVKSE